MIASIFDKCVSELEVNGGYALLPLSELQSSSSYNDVVFNAFQTARCALDKMKDDDFMPIIDPSTDSGGWTGYHKADSINGRYNHYREGIVFSNGELPCTTMNSIIDFQSDMKQFFHFCHDTVANGVLRAIERRLELPDCYFDNELGPTGDASQWHIKRYQLELKVNDPSKADNESTVLLPLHTDPSLISVVIVDGIGINEGGKGLEVLHPNVVFGSNDNKNKNSGTWKTISHHGHDVAIIFVGSVLSYLTKGQVFSAIKHRVVHDYIDDTNNRMAATLFVRPNPDCVMRILPSKYVKHECPSSGKLPPTFRVWNARVSKNYMKRGRKKQSE